MSSHDRDSKGQPNHGRLSPAALHPDGVGSGSAAVSPAPASPAPHTDFKHSHAFHNASSPPPPTSGGGGGGGGGSGNGSPSPPPTLGHTTSSVMAVLAHEHETVHQVIASLTAVLAEQKSNVLHGQALSSRLSAAIELLRGSGLGSATAATEEAHIKRNIREKRSSLKTAEEKEVVAFISREYLHRKRGSASAKLQKLNAAAAAVHSPTKAHTPTDASGYFKKAVEAVQFIQRIRDVKDVSSKIRTIKAIKMSDGLTPQEQIDFLLQREVIIASWEDISSWGFDMFRYEVFAGHRALAVLLTHLVTRFDFFTTFKIPRAAFAKFAVAIEEGYNAVPYHNHMHACDVTQNTFWFLQHASVYERITPLDMLAAIIAAAIHDFQHPGTTNAFQIATESDIAYRYNDKSVLENMHCSNAFMLMKSAETNFLTGLSREQKSSFRETVIAMVLATDMAFHFKNLAELRATIKKKTAENTSFDVKLPADRLMILETALHCSDLGNPAKPQSLSLRWTERVLEEFYQQGEKEKKLGLPISPMMDRSKPSVEISQMKFIEFVVAPLYETVVQVIPEAKECVTNMNANHAYWAAQLKAKEAAASPTAGPATATAATTPAPATAAATKS